MIAIFSSTLKKLAVCFKTMWFCHKIIPVWRRGYPAVFARALKICRQRRFEPYEAFRLGLFQPTFEQSRLDEYTSRKITTKLQKAVNPESWEPLLKNKGLFYRYLAACGLPVPRLYAIFFQKVPGWSPDGGVLAGRADWVRLLSSAPFDEFVIKPARGAFGSGIKIFKRLSGDFIDTQGDTFNAADIYDLMRSADDCESFIVQERLKNHPEIYRLSPSEFLQTVRVTTFIERGGNCRILFAFIKLISGQNITDNFHSGLSGNMLAMIMVEQGTPEPAIVTAPGGRGAIFFERHPISGVEFGAFHIPRWSEILTLAKEAAVRFLPVRTIGWDIAITPDGLKIVEGNIWWSPQNRRKWKNVIEAELPYDF